jgi:hypothetical protein
MLYPLVGVKRNGVSPPCDIDSQRRLTWPWLDGAARKRIHQRTETDKSRKLLDEVSWT